MNIIDLHDLASILLRERLLSSKQFRKARLIDISFPPADIADTDADDMVHYLLDEDNTSEEDADADLVVEPSNFIHPDFSNSSPKPNLADIEKIFWCCKHYNNTQTVAHAMQIILDNLPTSITKLRIRTSKGHSSVHNPSAFTIINYSIAPKSVICINRKIGPPGQKRTVIPYTFGLNSEERWITLVFGEGGEKVVLDLTTPMLGVRGLGSELFSLELMEEYYNCLLAPSSIIDIDGTKFLKRIIPGTSAQQVNWTADAMVLAERVLKRLLRIQQGEETFCFYCGKVGATKRCSRCMSVAYCNEHCQRIGWKYHKKWCSTDAALASDVTAKMTSFSI